ncbi:uncharacterized protein ARMOST_13610 [Armillaria ostoyae]|uniref:Uncharacterized protein n=1 Tax=Armillaria ostoyae TaxID=47428 RepID=A0A284RN85_ARMOS|nr:uncharacterized protein ARMOST_13610 [Armillaria ostoyae]
MARHQEEWTRREPRRNKIRHRATTLFITDNIKTQELFACVSLSSFHVSSVVNSHQHLIATPTSNASPPTSTSNPHPSIHYASGAIHAKEHITLTAVAGWPPEADIGEWKVVKSTLVGWPTDLTFHSLKAVLAAESNGDDVKTDVYMDGEFKVTQYGQGFVGSALYLIIDLQMEGSSVTPGPKGTMMFKIRNVEVTRTGS